MNESGTEGVVALRSLQLFLYFGVFRGRETGTEMHVEDNDALPAATLSRGRDPWNPALSVRW